ncbi:Asp-tRNA(Asn)/Glu-tRNA(Gln) amidotransferase subunit GatB [Candidatus Uhrbacteria bacterium]|nr:Asp-tRNA(Asn)/Glu-tRNA(Gln) amidotransferase subunit GatB [Candidatus Uhrbacteria bacterium]
MLQPIIGLEIHIRTNTQSKMFCGCPNMVEDEAPNTAICPICTGQPGTLPIINRIALEKGALMGAALGCTVAAFSKFDRKNYFYPDLPKGYQISQYDQPLCTNGAVVFDVASPKGKYQKKIRITRLHLEEDAGKLLHGKNKESYVDFNRAGSPLMEIVTEPDFRSPAEAKNFLQELQRIARYIGVSEADMEKGHLRCDANISMREVSGQGPVARDQEDWITDYSKLGPKTEVKNMNSFKSVERALEYEIIRQTKLWEEGNPVNFQSTRGWDDARGITVEQRTKEEAHDYRYFPEPDLPPITFTPERIAGIVQQLPELPAAKRQRFEQEYGFTSSDAAVFCDSKELAAFVEQVMAELTTWIRDTVGEASDAALQTRSKWTKLVAGWIGSKLLGVLNEQKRTLSTMKLDAENLAELLSMIATNKVNGTNALQLLTHMVVSGGDPSQILEEQGLAQVSDAASIQEHVDTVVAENPKVVADVKGGKVTALQFLVGQVMKKTKGRANPEIAAQLLRDKLGIE